MKTFLYSLIGIFCLTSISSFAQTPFKFGAYAGISSANMNFNNITTARSGRYDSKPGIRLGAFAEYVYSPLLSFAGDLSYIQNGTKSKDIIFTRKANNQMGFEELGTLDVRYDYIAFAPMVKVRYEGASVIPFVAAGPNVNFLVGTNEQGDFKTYNKMVLGYSAGIGTEINVNLPFSLMLELLYNHDITYAYNTDYFKVRNYSFAFQLGVKF
ncbi:MAG: outer membrane beta-barrel protein [Methanococcaceae archaeon]